MNFQIAETRIQRQSIILRALPGSKGTIDPNWTFNLGTKPCEHCKMTVTKTNINYYSTIFYSRAIITNIVQQAYELRKLGEQKTHMFSQLSLLLSTA